MNQQFVARGPLPPQSGIISKLCLSLIKHSFNCLLLCLMLCGHGTAAEGKTVLTVTGKHGITTDETPVELTLAMLEELPSTSFTSETPWTEGLVVWEGVRLSDLMEHLKSSSTSFHAVALDDYEITFEEVDFKKFPVILAYKMNGDYMTVRDLGPLWIMFPFDDHPDLDIQINRARSIWQLKKIELL